MIRISRPSRRAISLLVAAPFMTLACTSASTAGPTEAAAAATASPVKAVASAVTATPAPESTAETSASGGDTWRDIELTDAASGETFTLASLEGQVVAIEPMAVWCTNCKVQQDNVKQAYDDIEASGVRYISLGIDPNEGGDSLAEYAERRGYEWTFVTSPTEFSRALNNLFGAQILSPPSTPLIVLDADGEVVTQEFGFHGPEALLDILEAAAA